MSRIISAIRNSRGLPGYAAFVVGFMVLVIVEGAVVRATGSGAGCGAHWPLCNGQILPHHPRLATVIEFTHRSLTGICTTLVAVLIAWTFLARPRGDRVRKAAIATGILLISEGALGALLVLGHYVEDNASTTRVIVQCVHFSNTMLLLSAMTLTWWWLRPRETTPLSSNGRIAAIFALLATILTGATGSVAALADTLFPSPSVHAALAQDFSTSAPLLIRMRWIHPASALLAFTATLWLLPQLRALPRRLIREILLAQLALGVADVLLLAPVSMQVLHLLFADLFWIALVAACSSLLEAKTDACAYGCQ
jgi:cytochrome c oxidase assembly protein subunit 15